MSKKHLYEVVVSVASHSKPATLYTRVFKYPVKETKINLLPLDAVDESESRLLARVRVGRLDKIHGTTANHRVTRRVFTMREHLVKQYKQEAVNLVERALLEMKREIELMLSAIP